VGGGDYGRTRSPGRPVEHPLCLCGAEKCSVVQAGRELLHFVVEQTAQAHNEVGEGSGADLCGLVGQFVAQDRRDILQRDDAFAAAITDPNPVTADSQQLRERLQDGLRNLLARTAAADAMDPALTVADVMLLLCGVGFAIRHAPDRDDPDLPDRYLSALLNGVLTRRDG
jgi:hypothetical protein